jgi:hypothetical protein
VKYSFRFVSVVAPGASSKSPVIALNSYGPLPKKVLLKRSFLLASWLFYLAGGQAKPVNKQIGIAVLPSRRSLYTLTKAPMAHKTRSKEQFMFKTYNFKFSVAIPLDSALVPSSVSNGAYGSYIVSSSFPTFETNSLFLKSFLISYPISDAKFFSTLF